MFIKRISFIVLTLILITAFGVNLIGCDMKAYSTKFFSYPPKSKPHENNWQYFGSIKMVSSKKGAFSILSDKTVYLSIKDRNNKNYLSDKIQFECGGIKASIKWDQFDTLEITLNEIGSKHVNDNYNKQLLKKGPNCLKHLIYKYDSELKKFGRNN